MKKINTLLVACLLSSMLCSCTTTRSTGGYSGGYSGYAYQQPVDYSCRIPSTIACKEKTIVVDPHVHVWGAYEGGQLVKAGLATAGANWCPDINRPCRTSVGSFRIHSLGSADCKSSKYPLPKGGGPMPYCMFFNGGQSLHGSHEVVEDNLSHGCVRMEMADVEWVRFNFADVGTRVVVKSY